MRKSTVALLVLFLALTAGWALAASDESRSPQPEQVVYDYFKYYNARDNNGVLSTLTPWRRSQNTAWNLDKLTYIQVLSLQQETDPARKAAYIASGHGRDAGVTADNVMVYRVEYDVRYWEEGPQRSGRYTAWYYVVRQDGKSPWLIDDMGN